MSDEDRGDDRQLADEACRWPSGSARRPARRPMVKLSDQEDERCRARSAPASRHRMLPCEARPKVIAMMIQPIVSSMIAEATMTWPTLRRMKSISRTTIATIFTEEIDSAVPRNSEVTSRCSGSGSSASGSNSPSAKPQTNGTAMPATETLIAARRDLAHQREVGLHAGEQQQQQDAELRDAVEHRLLRRARRKQRVLRLRPEQRRTPRAEQQCRRAAAPITAGWPIRCISSPSPRPSAISSTICTSKSNSDGRAAFSAAKAGVAEKSAKQRAAPASTGRRRRTPLSEIMRAFQSKRSIWRVSDGRDRASSVWSRERRLRLRGWDV